MSFKGYSTVERIRDRDVAGQEGTESCIFYTLCKYTAYIRPPYNTTDNTTSPRRSPNHCLQMLYCSDKIPKPQRYTIGGSDVLGATWERRAGSDLGATCMLVVEVVKVVKSARWYVVDKRA